MTTIAAAARPVEITSFRCAAIVSAKIKHKNNAEMY